MNITEALLHALKERGAREIWGIPGDFALPYFRIIEESGILPLYTLTHEPGVGFAADAAARFRKGLGVAAVTYGAGAINMLNAVAQAFAEKSPVVVISGAPGTVERGRGLLLHHQVKTIGSQFRMYQEVTCDQGILDDPATAPAIIDRVLRNCLEHSRPVYLEIPRDMPAVPCEPVPPHTPSPCDDEAVAACAAEVLARLRGASRPVLMVGVEVRRYALEDRVAELADRLGVPVVTSFMGRGLLAGKECLQGTYLGVAGDAGITTAVEESDGLLLLGVIMSDTNFGVSSRHMDPRRLMHAEDRQVRMGFHSYHDIPLAGLVEALLAALAAENGGRGGTGHCHAGALAEPLGRNVHYRRGFVADDAPVTPDDIAVLLNDFYAPGAAGLGEGDTPWPLACDIGDCLFTALSVRPVPMVGPGYYASMGFGVPAGMGLQVATGLRSLTLVGDGAFQMTGMELGNCSRLGIDPVVIVFNNASWEMLRVFQPGAAYNAINELDFAALADALGGRGHRAATRSELAEAFAAATRERGRFQLIDARLPKGAISATLASFVAGVRRVSGMK